MTDQQEENGSLKKDILEVIDSLLARPEMFSNDVAGLEGQFFNLVTLVAPYAFDMTSRDAGEKILGYVTLATGNMNSLSAFTEDISLAASMLKQLYVENFECYTRSETLH
jgi:hypothetical protein